MVMFYRSEGLRQGVTQLYADALEGGRLELYTGSMPINGGEITVQTRVAVFNFNTPAGVVVLGEFNLDTTGLDILADNTGVVTWGRIYDADGDFVLDADAGVDGTNTIIKVNPSSVYQGGSLRINQFILRG